eukprot:TRINITY_DN6659_c0_g1_i2.p1 TRINITY_DN6659_c0_g1~~TRINITY_DN6659_c0_g1_i2.p1  ORF type:complete len:240 (-),score=65.37 TRINITY_DN6659_c0_g1_i2:169-858(-)
MAAPVDLGHLQVDLSCHTPQFVSRQGVKVTRAGSRVKDISGGPDIQMQHNPDTVYAVVRLNFELPESDIVKVAFVSNGTGVRYGVCTRDCSATTHMGETDQAWAFASYWGRLKHATPGLDTGSAYGVAHSKQVTVVVDMNLRMLSYELDGKPYGVAFHALPRVPLAVAVAPGRGFHVDIKSFEYDPSKTSGNAAVTVGHAPESSTQEASGSFLGSLLQMCNPGCMPKSP